jgi:PPIC-type PPIASE domain
VFLRRATPPEQRISGAHVVIGHDQARWIEVVGRRAPPRTREAALLLATRIQREAQASPEAFARLAEQHSDHRDATRGGDFGTWSTHEPSPFARELELLSELQVGEISEPIDTLLGFQVLQRTPNRSRREYAMERLLLRFDAALPEGTPGSRSAVKARAEQLAAEVQGDPRRYDDLRREHCCAEPLGVIEGRESPELEHVLAQLQFGQVAAQPIEWASVFYLIPRRVELARLAPRPATRFELSRSQ